MAPLDLLLSVPFIRTSLSNFNGTTLPTLDISDSSSSSNTRTLLDILWSCALTLFAGTYTAIHTNIPGMKEGKLVKTSRRVLIMLLALTAPEIVITWAARQCFSARKAAKEFNDTFGGRVAHSHGDNQNLEQDCHGGTAPLLLATLPLHERNNLSTSAPQAEAVKFTGWTMTHGFFAWMGGFMLCVNDEPRATLTPDELMKFVLDGSIDMPVITEEDIEDRSKGDVLSKGVAIMQLVWFVLQLAARYFQNLPISLLEIDTLAVATMTCIAYALWWKKPKDVGRPYLVHWKPTASLPSKLEYDKADKSFVAGSRWHYLNRFLENLTSMKPLISPGAVRSRRVPSFGGYTPIHDSITILYVGCISGTIFGAIHCTGWNVLFQGRIIWHVASIAILCSPGFIIIISPVILVYVVARIGLIVIMLLSLRSLPPGTYDTVAWTKFIPHTNL